jgi:hypothetical protein
MLSKKTYWEQELNQNYYYDSSDESEVLKSFFGSRSSKPRNTFSDEMSKIRSYCWEHYAEVIYAFSLSTLQGPDLDQIAEYSMEAGGLCEGKPDRFRELYSHIKKLRLKLSKGNDKIDQNLIKFQNAISKAAQDYWQLTQS